MQGIVLQLSRGLLLILLWLFIYLVVRSLRRDLQAVSGGPAASGPIQRQGGGIFARSKAIRHLVVTEGALQGTRITLADQPVLLGRAPNSTLVIDDDYASNQHARLVPHGSEWFLEDLGSTNGTFLDRTKVTTPVRVPAGTPVRIGTTTIELRS
ncbi:FHA domain-containing protein FhaB/FipA [Dietzia sp.]|uniref:FHA domain-containing protein FhaB/FipA n=1 Tax=Dietzia sp. TaxID=1871616 RepID=UPI002FD96C7B